MAVSSHPSQSVLSVNKTLFLVLGGRGTPNSISNDVWSDPKVDPFWYLTVWPMPLVQIMSMIDFVWLL